MAEEVIGLLFGVEGVGVNGASGQEIVKGLTQIVNEINSGKSTVPKIKFHFDTTEATKAVDDLKAKLKDIEKIASIKVTQSGGKSGQGGTTQDLQKQIEKYQKLSVTIKQWVQTSKQAAKLSEEYSTITRESDGTLSGTTKGYEQTVAVINEVNKAMKELRLTFDEDGKPIKPDKEQFAEIAAQIGITEEQYRKLFEQVEVGSDTVGVNVENAHRKNQQSWTATASKIRDEVQRMYDTIAKDPNAQKMADEIIRYSKSATGSVGELKNKYDELRNAIHESGADIETWGDKFKKTFAGKVRSALAAAVTAVFTKYLREIYQNVVNIDKALVNLQIASGKTREETKRLIKEYAALAKQLGATTIEVAEAADTWLRQGYSAEEANTLIANSMMLSKLGQMESAEASRALTSAMKGYGVAVEDSVRIVDKLTKVDMEAAASAGDIATAMAETATSAKLSGVSMDTLIGYLTTVKEVTQDGSESVGVFFKTLFARMNNVKAGKFIDDETGESLNDVESVLHKLGIELRGANDEFRNSSDVLSEVAARWDKFNDTERNAIATAMAGSRQFEKFNVLMTNYGTAMEYAETSTESAGTAIEKFSDYTEGIEASLNSLQASFAELSIALLDSEIIVGFTDFLAGAVGFLNEIASVADGMLVTIPAITLALVALHAILLQIKTTQTFTAMVAGLKGVLAIFPAILAQARAWVLSLKAQALGHTMTTAALNAQAAATQAATAAQTAMNATNPIGWIMLAVTAIYALVKAIDAAGTAWKDSYERAKKAADEQKALVEEYDSEIDSLESLQAKLIDAQGNRQKLASIYDELNSKIAVSSALLRGEESAYKAATAQIRDQINAKKALREEALKEKLEQERSAFENNQASRYGLFGWDFLALDALGENMRSFMRGTFMDDVDYDIFYNQWSTEFQDKWLMTSGFTRESWDAYWKAQVDTANEVFSSIIDDADGVFNDGFMSSAVERLIRGGYNLDETYAVLDELENNSTELNQKISQYYEELMSGSDLAPGTYGEIQDIFDGYIERYPALEKLFTSLLTSIRTLIKGTTVELKSINDVFDETQEGFDGLVSAMSDVTSEGYLTADALTSLAKLEKENALGGLTLAEILTQDANGYKLASNALEQYVTKIIEAVKAEYAAITAFATAQDKQNALDNLDAYIGVLTALIATTEDSVDASKAQRAALEAEQEMYENQRDAFEELIDIRKELLQTYADEVSYQRELEKKQRAVSSLQQKLSVARLDSSAAGQARVRELEAELQEAQDDLDDFTLEHAIDVLTAQLEAESVENEAFFQQHLDRIEGLLAGLDTSPEANVNIDTSWASTLLTGLNEVKTELGSLGVNDGSSETGTGRSVGSGTQGTYDQWSAAWYAANPGIYGPPPPVPSGWSVGDPVPGAAKTRWTSYQDAADAGFSNIRTRSEFGRDDNSDKQKYGTYQAYLDAMYEKYMGKAPVYHSGGLVGDITTLSSSEEFAKLLKGEFVSTPAQMKRFMEETLPKIANYSATGGSNEFNAPLIEITCESVTTEALPELERIVNEAVKKIKRELDSGMSRTGFKRTPTKRLT